MTRRDRPWWSASLRGVALGAKPWVAFLPILLLFRRHRAHAIVLAGALATEVWVPFLAAAPGTVEALRDLRLSVDRHSAAARASGRSPSAGKSSGVGIVASVQSR